MNWFNFEFNSFLWLFVVLNVTNVIIQTVKSLATIKWGKLPAAIVNAIAYGLYTVVVVYMTLEGLGLFWKALIIALANLIGVYAVKAWEEKKQKERLWKIEACVPQENAEAFYQELKQSRIPCNFCSVGDWTAFSCYCATKKQSVSVTKFARKYEAKFSAYESKELGG